MPFVQQCVHGARLKVPLGGHCFLYVVIGFAFFVEVRAGIG